MRHAVLVVEDRKTIRDGIVQALDKEGFVGIPAANGQEALDYLNAGGGAAVIVLDLMMPVMDGWTFRRAQRQQPQIASIPTIILSSLDGRPVDGSMPAAAVFQKPVEIRTLIATIRTLCADRDGPNALPQIPDTPSVHPL
jgi:CheY-like chemotaxis protein